MIHTIHKGTHKPLRMPKLCTSKDIRFRVRFNETARYDIGFLDQEDWNKLFGIGYFPHHQLDSVRVAWRYNIVTDKIELGAYWYNSGVRFDRYMTSIDIGEDVLIGLHRRSEGHHYIMMGSICLKHVQVSSDHIGFWLLPYFGGNQTAPHDIKIEMRRVR